MSSNCSSGACSTGSAGAASSSSGGCSSGSCGGGCASKGPADCLAKIECPIEGATQCWAQSFGDALKQAQTEVLKAKIHKAYGPMLDQAADAMLATMGALWQAKIAEAKVGQAKHAFQERLFELWTQEPAKK